MRRNAVTFRECAPNARGWKDVESTMIDKYFLDRRRHL